MPKMLQHISALWSKYLAWVADHPVLATDVETILKWISYLATGYLRNSEKSLLWSELAFSLGDVVKFLNDRAYEQVFKVANAVEYNNVEYLLGFLDTAEILLEVGVGLVGGEAARWTAIAVIQFLKCAWRLILLVKKKQMLKKPVLAPVKRKELFDPVAEHKQPKIIHLNSGRSMRSIAAAPIGPNRSWQLQPDEFKHLKSTRLNGQQQMAEVSYVLQPIAHLISTAICGLDSWKPWLISLTLDFFSHGLHGNISKLTSAEQSELWRRRYQLAMYLLRSPFYDEWTRKTLLTIILFAQRNVPLGGHLSSILLAYIPHYRRIYALLWSK